MKFCEKCWSDKLINAPGLITCKGCGHSKKVLNVVVNNEVESGLYGKRHQSFITEKSSSKYRMIEETQHEDTRWRDKLLIFQKTLKQAAQSFAQHHHINASKSLLFIASLKTIWIRYVTRWKQLDLPMNSILTNSACQSDQQEEQLDQIPEEQMKEEEQQEQGEQMNHSKRRRSTLVDFSFEMDVDQEAKNALIKEQSEVEKMTDHQIVNQISSLTGSMTMNTHPYFKKLLTLKIQNKNIVQTMIRQYIRRLFYLHMNRKLGSKEKLSYLKNKKMYLRLSWLRQMVKNRNEPNYGTMTQHNLSIYIFMFDILQFRLCYKSTENRRNLKQMINRYAQTPKYNNKIIDACLSKLQLLTLYDSIYAHQNKQQEGLPPALTFNLIYSFIHLALLQSQLVYYIGEILQHTYIDSSKWVQLNYLKVNSTPSIIQIRKNSINLLHTLQIVPKESNRGRWIDRICEEMGLQNYKDVLKILTQTLITTPDWFVNQDVQCLAIMIIFVKLMVNIDDQSNASLIPLQRIMNKYKVLENSDRNKLVIFWKKMQKQLPEYFQDLQQLNLYKILLRIRKTNSNLIVSNDTQIQKRKRKFQNINDLKFLTLSSFKSVKFQDEALSTKSSTEFTKYHQIFQRAHKISVVQNQIMSINVQENNDKDNKQSVQLRSYVLNEVPESLNQTLSGCQVILPCNNYEVVSDFRSNYYPLNKNQLMQLLGNACQNRCSIDELYRKIESVQKQLLIFQAS